MRGGGWRLCMGRCLTRGTVSDSSREGCAVVVVRSGEEESLLCTAYASEFEEVNFRPFGAVDLSTGVRGTGIIL